LYAINIDPHHWGTGVGRALLAAAQAELARLGYAQAVLWVLPDNARARRFYEVAGWTTDGVQRTTEVRGVVVPEVRYRRRLQGLPSKA
jgi:RimJ/RimL family protein N-acetyltransferase